MMAVTLRFSRAMVHSAWMVYMAVPSPISAITGRCGQAIAAPTALGRPWPMAPPVSVMRSWRGQPAVITPSIRPLVMASSMTMARSGSNAPTALQTLGAVSLPVGRLGRCGACRRGWAAPAPSAAASCSRLAAAFCSGVARVCTWQVSGTR